MPLAKAFTPGSPPSPRSLPRTLPLMGRAPGRRPADHASVATGSSRTGNSLDRVFISMLDAYRATGGLVRADDVAPMLRFESGQDLRVLARWIATRWVLSFEWNGEHWLPMFQFIQPAMSVRATLHPVLAELAPAMDRWDMAQWFASPNPWLEEQLPANLLATQGNAVLQAARADRFALAG